MLAEIYIEVLIREKAALLALDAKEMGCPLLLLKLSLTGYHLFHLDMFTISP